MSGLYSDSRLKRLAVSQRQLILLQKYGDQGVIGLSALDRLRETMLGLSTNIEESFDDDLFQYHLGTEHLCVVNWHRTGIQIIFAATAGPLIFEVGEDDTADWDMIRHELAIRIPSRP